MADFENVAKKYMKTSPMYVYRLQSSAKQSYCVIDLSIKNFFHLKDNTEYRLDIYEFQMDVYIIKNRRSLTASIIADSCNQVVECFINYGTGEYSVPAYPKTMASSNIREIELPSSLVDNPKNAALKKGFMCLVFKCEPITEPVEIFRTTEGAEDHDENDTIFSRRTGRNRKIQKSDKDLRPTYLPDFFLFNLDHFRFSVHKSILAARSPFFFEYFNAYKETRQFALPGVTQRAIIPVIQYLYTGKIVVHDVDVMLEILEVAISMKIKSLEKLCINYVKRMIDAYNVQRIKTVGKQLVLETLLKACDSFQSESKNSAKRGPIEITIPKAKN